MQHFFDNSYFGEEWFTFPETYSSFARTIKDGSIIVEVGSWKGRSAAYLAVELINAGKNNVQFYCIDTWEGSLEHRDPRSIFYDPNIDKLFESFLSNTRPVINLIKPIKKPSTLAVKNFEDNSVDIVFLDACHEYQCVKDDIKAWLPKIKNGGILSGHDYRNSWPGVDAAVDEAFGDNVTIISHEFCWLYKKL